MKDVRSAIRSSKGNKELRISETTVKGHLLRAFDKALDLHPAR